MLPKKVVVAPEFVRELNKAQILNIVRQERMISRTDIAKQARLSRSTVSIIVNELIEEGWIRESGPGQSRGGRRPRLGGKCLGDRHLRRTRGRRRIKAL